MVNLLQIERDDLSRSFLKYSPEEIDNFFKNWKKLSGDNIIDIIDMYGDNIIKPILFAENPKDVHEIINEYSREIPNKLISEIVERSAKRGKGRKSETSKERRMEQYYSVLSWH